MLVIKNARLTKEGTPVDIAVENGLISEIGTGLAEGLPGPQVVEANGSFVTPGLIDSNVYIGLLETEAGDEGRDQDEVSGPVQPHLRALDAIHWEDNGFFYALGGGITTVVTGPGRANVFGGQALAMRTAGKGVAGRLIKEPCSLRVSMGDPAKNAYKDGPKMPATRMGTAAMVREQFIKARDYAEGKNGDGKPKFDMALEAIARFLEERLPVTFHAKRSDDIVTAIRIIREFDLNGVIVGAKEGHKVAKHIAESGVPVIFIPQIMGAMEYEDKGSTFETAAALKEAGVKLAISSGAPRPPAQHLTLLAALCRKAGLDRQSALQAITSVPAEIFGLGGLGRVEVGAPADIVIWNGDPFDLKGYPEQVFSDGSLVFDAEKDQLPW